ncbi:hypothetical protein OZX61_12730 (plasmid) [Acinetobacter sp. ESL0695]|uniref:hypothetical protein n=1 Tax=Acinetobacter sp. ESL0695 TaxID=2983215 RepID=UPI0023F4F00C|nr:hypothetical protein [Acinetobacter sp. ESL0695]WEV50258.1 hypothetical protein OZX61_12730 [Acinetobacter sp. ESL0695]
MKYSDNTHTQVVLNNAKISDLKDGEISATSKDAVNGSQLYQANLTSQNYTDSQVSNLSNNFNQRFNQLDKKLNSGVASAIAIASLAQPIQPGKSALAIGTGTWNNSTNLAIGASGVTQDSKINGKTVNYIWKMAGTTDFNGNAGGGASVAVTW